MAYAPHTPADRGRMLEALGLDVDICHLNEGHAAFVVVERARHFMQRHGTTFREALWATRAGNVFTTHTAVPAGFDAFSTGEVERHQAYFDEYVRGLGLSWPELLALGDGRIGSAVVPQDRIGHIHAPEVPDVDPATVKAVIARSFARIHETNLKKQGVLPLTFANPADYDKINKDDTLDIQGLNALTPGQPVAVVVHKPDGGTVNLTLIHSLNAEQIRWFRAGSAMNAVNRPELVRS